MFKLQTKASPRADWKDVRFAPRFATAAAALEYAATLDEDGIFNPAAFRAVPA